MILFPILLALLSWLLILWLCKQHIYLNIFEQIVLWFISALALFVLELFIQWVVFGHLSLLFPICTFLILIGVFVYKNIKNPWYAKKIFDSLQASVVDIGHQFANIQVRKKFLVIALVIYSLIKVGMVFSINTHMPTFDEDAVAGWDIKTKIFASNQSLVLDTTSPEYFGTDYGRYPFVGILDTYFLLPYGWFVNGLSNIISPLMYLFGFLLLFGIFLRKTNLFWSTLAGYVFCSLPFVFIHGFGSYRNFPAGVFLFIFVFYLIDQLFLIDKEYGTNMDIIRPILLVWFLSSVIRNEGVMLTGISFLVIVFFYHIFKKWHTKEIRYQLWPLLPVVLGYVINKIIFSFYPAWTALNTWGTELSSNLFASFFTNITQPGVLVAPFQQMFYHPDYSLLFILFTLALYLFVRNYKKMKWLLLIFTITLLLILIFMFVLYANVQSLGLLSHFAFIRYPVSIILFLVYVTIYSFYFSLKDYEHWL